LPGKRPPGYFSPVGTLENSDIPIVLRDEKTGETFFPAINCRAILKCPCGTKKLGYLPGNKLPGYSQMSLQDKKY
jgi:hypothetical protein